jgi:hypothetical protein
VPPKHPRVKDESAARFVTAEGFWMCCGSPSRDSSRDWWAVADERVRQMVTELAEGLSGPPQ